MKSPWMSAAFSVGFALSTFSQSDSVSLKDLEIPDAPGFMLLDKSPTTIQTPTSSKAFIISALHAINENSGIPKNYAVDLTPFWFFRHPQMTAYKYAGYDIAQNKQLIFSQLQKASVSFAYVTGYDSLTVKDVSNFAVGLRANIITFRSAKDIADLKQANNLLVDQLKSEQERLKAYVGDILLSVTDPVLYELKVREFYAKEATYKTVQKSQIADILKRHALFSLDGAVAWSGFFLDNQYANDHFGRFGSWLTVHVSKVLDPKQEHQNYLNIYAIGRYLADATQRNEAGDFTTHNFIDAGGKLELEFRKLAIGYEYLYRTNPDNSTHTYRSNGLLKYRVSDQLFLTAAFGRNFGTENNLISLLGLNWGLSSGTEKAIVR
jgi:hypothetical protein